MVLLGYAEQASKLVLEAVALSRNAGGNMLGFTLCFVAIIHACVREYEKIPKFTAKNKINLNGILKSMGLDNAFSSNANFSLMNGKKNLSLTEVLQSSLFSIDEKGIVAAAATAATLSITSIHPKETRASFIADRPFAYFLVDLDTKAILFMGVYESP